MTYSRTRTSDKKKVARGKRTRRLLWINLSILACIVGAAIFIWLGQQDAKPQSIQSSDEPAASITTSPNEDGEPIATDSGGKVGATEENGDNTAAEDDTAADDQAEASDSTSGSVTIALVGDILPAASVLDYMNKFGFDYPFRETSSLLQAADITAGNLETAITTRGKVEENKEYVYRGPKEALVPIKEAGFDFLSLANNHSMDYGWEGLRDTMDALDDADLQHAGSGIDDTEAYTPAYIDSNGMTVGFVSLTRVIPISKTNWKADKINPGLAEAYSTERAVAAIKEARSNADVVIVMVHWGDERTDMPNKFQKSLAYAFIDAGADLVVGSHPHVLQGFESYKGKWIAYSLGNFVFPGMSPPSTAETGILTATCKLGSDCSLQFAPMISKLAQPVQMDAESGKALLAHLSSISFASTVEEDGTIVASNP
jgi:poly-gamma-glutamate capsule biosynthesis protein CapA/YwtB (metallophosphatase superfamily)